MNKSTAIAADRSKVRLGKAIRRARAAIDRHGLPNLASIAFRALFGLGLGKTLTLAAGDQPFLSAVQVPPKGPGGVDRRWPPQIDGMGTVSAIAWARWFARSPSRPLSPAPTGSSASFVFVIDVSSAPPEALRRTRQAIQAMGADHVVIETDEWVPAAATFYAFLRAGDVPGLDFLRCLREAAGDAAAAIITFDLFRRSDERVRPILMPGANPPLLAARDYIFSRAAVKGSALLGATQATPREAILGWCAGRSVAEVRTGWRHIGRPLVEAMICDEQLGQFLQPPVAPTRRRKGSGQSEPASAIICTRDKGHLTRQLVRQLLALGKDQVGEVVILSNGTTNPYALQTLSDLAQDPRIQVIRNDAPFNFSHLCNTGVRQSRGRGPLLFVNDDIAPVSDDWLGALTDQLMIPGAGAVGPLLLYPNERVQHAGIYLRFPSGVGHVLRGAALPRDDPMGLAAAAREVSSLTGAVLLTQRQAFEQVGGFDAQLAISFQDIDYCLKLYQLGLRNIFEPKSVLIHMESVSLDQAGTDQGMLAQRYREKALFMGRWANIFSVDPFYPAGLDLEDESALRLTAGRP